MNKQNTYQSKKEITYTVNPFDAIICILAYLVFGISGNQIVLYFSIMYTIYTLLSVFDIYYEKEVIKHKNPDESENNELEELKEEYSTSDTMTEDEFEEDLEDLLVEKQ